ncbi:MAG: hypothetical protein WC464_01640 [Bdellovibrionales bacterium]
MPTRRPFALAIPLCAFIAFAFVSPAKAALLGQPCPNEFGKTRMDEDKANLIACLYDGANLVWKPMTTKNTSITCASGQVLTGIAFGQPVCSTLTFSCPTGQVITSISNGQPTCGTAQTIPVVKTCPAQVVFSGACSGIMGGVPVSSVSNGKAEIVGGTSLVITAPVASGGSVVNWSAQCYIQSAQWWRNDLWPLYIGHSVCSEGSWR